jgi:hypothetical protein
MLNSQVQFYSIGVVAKDKEPGTDYIDVIGIEVNFVNPTNVDAETSEDEFTHISNGSQDNLKIKQGNSIRARWWKWNTNRKTSPDVCKEDSVMVFRLGETDMFFWMDFDLSNVKRLENVIFAWAADPNNQMADDFSNAYVLNVSSKEGHITLRTSMVNGEKAAFLHQFNTRDGTWICQDHKGNKYWINSVEDDVGFENAMLSKVNANKEDIFMFSKRSINLETKLISEKCEQRVSNASASMKWATKDWLTTSPVSMFKGPLEVTTDFKYGGKGTGIGTFTVSEAIIANITFSVHTHTEQGDGKDVSTPH